MTNEDDIRNIPANELGRMPYDLSQIAKTFDRLTESLDKSVGAQIMAEQLDHWQKALTPLTAVHMNPIFHQINSLNSLNSLLVQLIERHMGTLERAIRAIPQTLTPLLNPFEYEQKIEKISQATGWLPYRTAPFAQILEKQDSDANTFSDRVRDYYNENQDEIINDISGRLTEYTVDDETKNIIREALELHKSGHFHFVCLGILPLIEKVVREDWFKIVDISSGQYGKIQKQIDCQPFRELIWDGRYEWIIIKWIMEKLYKLVKDENLEEIKQNTIPNRHAASHGWANYNTDKHSLNAIICADYVIRVASQWNNAAADGGGWAA